MPNRRPPDASDQSSAQPSAGFRKRYDQIETHRAALIARLAALGEPGQQHPGYQRAFTLLNTTFRKAKLAQRLAILQAATWLIDLLEKLTTIT